jgi:hypothetical protein
MNKLLVLKDVAYAAKVGGGTIAGYNDVDTLVDGALAFFNDQGALITLANLATTTPDSKYFTAVAGRLEDTIIVPIIPRQGVKGVNIQLYRAATKPVITVASLSVVDGDVGEFSITVKDITYSSKNFTRSVRATVYKKASVTASAAIDELVAKLNAGSSFITAAKTGGGPYNVTITPNEDDVVLGVSLGGLIEGDAFSTTTPFVHSRGTGADILQMEKDFSAEEGNGNYTEYTDLWYKRVMETVLATNYDVVTFNWEGTHSSPTRTHNVMKNIVCIACDNDAEADTPPASNQTAVEVAAFLAAIVGTAYSATVGEEPVLDDGTETDAIAGN